jgi:hypothetical protein
VSVDMIGSLARALADPELDIFEFIALARALRALRSGWECDGMICSIRSWLLVPPVRHHTKLDPRVRRLLFDLERFGTAKPAFAGVEALSCNTGREPLRDVLLRETGCTFPQLRRAVMVKRMLASLALTDEHVRQIAFQVGYTFASECDRDFQCILCMTPKAYRRLVRRDSSSV